MPGSRPRKAKWIAFLDDDDLWEPSRLEAELSSRTRRRDVVFCNIVKFDESAARSSAAAAPPGMLSPRQ